MNKTYCIICIMILSLFACRKDKEIPIDNLDGTLGSIVINYNNNQDFQISNIPDSCAVYNSSNHTVYLNSNYTSCNDKLIMKICINLDSITYPFHFPKKTVNTADYCYDSPVTNNQCASLTFFKIISPDTVISDFKMISADTQSEFILLNYTNNNLKGNFNGNLYCFIKHYTCEYVPDDNCVIIDSLIINSAMFDINFIRK